MPTKVTCPDCGSNAVRVRRGAIERLFYAEVFRCRNCNKRVRLLRPGLWPFRRASIKDDPDP